MSLGARAGVTGAEPPGNGFAHLYPKPIRSVPRRAQSLRRGGGGAATRASKGALRYRSIPEGPGWELVRRSWAGFSGQS